MKKEYNSPEVELKVIFLKDSISTLSALEPEMSGEDWIEPF